MCFVFSVTSLKQVWLVPSKEDWIVLTDYLGGEEIAGSKLKETGHSHWISTFDDATNETGFTALPGGRRNYYAGNFYGIGSSGSWWSSSEHEYVSEHLLFLYMLYNQTSASIGDGSKLNGFCVRCIRD